MLNSCLNDGSSNSEPDNCVRERVGDGVALSVRDAGEGDVVAGDDDSGEGSLFSESTT